MQLRFLKGNWEFGKFKLQFLHPDGYWEDVPIESNEKTLVEKFMAPVDKYAYSKSGKGISGYLISKEVLDELADIATKHFQEKKD